MCSGCWEQWVAEGAPAPFTNEMRRCVLLIDAIYHGADRLSGGSLHCELDDFNIEDHFFEATTLEEAKPYLLDRSDRWRQDILDVERWCYLCLKGLTDLERATVVATYHSYHETDPLMRAMLDEAREERDMAAFFASEEWLNATR